MKKKTELKRIRWTGASFGSIKKGKKQNAMYLKRQARSKKQESKKGFNIFDYFFGK